MTDYTGAAYQDETYTIAHDEFVAIAGLFNVVVAVGMAQEKQAAPLLPAGASIDVLTIKSRRDALTPVIELAQSQCRNQKDAAEVWGKLQVLANNKHAPLLRTSEDGLDYLHKDTVKAFTRDALSKRLAR